METISNKITDRYTADFETTTDENDCRVWAWAVCSIENPLDFWYGNDLEDFFDFCYDHPGNYYFHNLKFDGQFIIDWLLKHGYIWTEKLNRHSFYEFTSTILDTGQFYSISVKQYPNTKKVQFLDSFKILAFAVEKIAKDFQLPIRKLDLDYYGYREERHELTEHEVEYIRNDVEIMARALQIMFSQGLDRMTISSDALAEYKRTVNFTEVFPIVNLEADTLMRPAYKGGFTWLNPVWAGVDITGGGVVFDKNSMYPWVLHDKMLPYGVPESFDGQYEFDKRYPLYIQFLNCTFKIKPGKIPSIQLKSSMFFRQNEYLESSDDRIVTLALCNPDLELFFEHYDVWNLSYAGGYKFMGRVGLFTKYVDKWTEEKIKSKAEGNGAMYTISKLCLNSVYGKFGTSRKSIMKIPYLDDNGVVNYQLSEPIEKDGIYLPVAAFTTAYARQDIIRTSQFVRDWSLKKYGEDLHVYCDTDSVHIARQLSSEDAQELSQILDIDDYRLGAWKLESVFTRGKYLRQKCYLHEEDGRIVPTIAGFPKSLAPILDFDNFDIGFTTEGMTLDKMLKIAKSKGYSEAEISKMKPKLRYKKVAGGVVLVDTDFTIK